MYVSDICIHIHACVTYFFAYLDTRLRSGSASLEAKGPVLLLDNIMFILSGF